MKCARRRRFYLGEASGEKTNKSLTQVRLCLYFTALLRRWHEPVSLRRFKSAQMTRIPSVHIICRIGRRRGRLNSRVPSSFRGFELISHSLNTLPFGEFKSQECYDGGIVCVPGSCPQTVKSKGMSEVCCLTCQWLHSVVSCSRVCQRAAKEKAGKRMLVVSV